MLDQLPVPVRKAPVNGLGKSGHWSTDSQNILLNFMTNYFSEVVLSPNGQRVHCGPIDVPESLQGESARFAKEDAEKQLHHQSHFFVSKQVEDHDPVLEALLACRVGQVGRMESERLTTTLLDQNGLLEVCDYLLPNSLVEHHSVFNGVL